MSSPARWSAASKLPAHARCAAQPLSSSQHLFCSLTHSSRRCAGRSGARGRAGSAARRSPSTRRGAGPAAGPRSRRCCSSPHKKLTLVVDKDEGADRLLAGQQRGVLRGRPRTAGAYIAGLGEREEGGVAMGGVSGAGECDVMLSRKTRLYSAHTRHLALFWRDLFGEMVFPWRQPRSRVLQAAFIRPPKSRRG